MKAPLFTIPLGKPSHEVMTLERFIQDVGNPAVRTTLVESYVGERKRRRFEIQRGLPHGALELVAMLDDDRVQQTATRLVARLVKIVDDGDPKGIRDLRAEALSINAGLERLYPGAIRLLKRHALASAQLSGSSIHENDQAFFQECQFIIGPVAVFAAGIGIVTAVGVVNVAAIVNVGWFWTATSHWSAFGDGRVRDGGKDGVKDAIRDTAKDIQRDVGRDIRPPPPPTGGGGGGPPPTGGGGGCAVPCR